MEYSTHLIRGVMGGIMVGQYLSIMGFLGRMMFILVCSSELGRPHLPMFCRSIFYNGREFLGLGIGALLVRRVFSVIVSCLFSRGLFALFRILLLIWAFLRFLMYNPLFPLRVGHVWILGEMRLL